MVWCGVLGTSENSEPPAEDEQSSKGKMFFTFALQTGAPDELTQGLGHLKDKMA